MGSWDGSEAGSGDEASACNLPLAVSAGILSALVLVESMAPLAELYSLGWWKALTTAIVLKVYTFEISIAAGEKLLCSQCMESGDRAQSFAARVLQLYVHAARLSRDIFASSLILALLSPGVLMNSINETLCAGCSLHQLLIYRAPNVKAKIDEHGEGETSEEEEMMRLSP